jgi:hypothetical protein
MSVAVEPNTHNDSPARLPLRPQPPLPWHNFYHSSFTEAAVRIEPAALDISNATILPPREEQRHVCYIEEDRTKLPSASILATDTVDVTASPLVSIVTVDLRSSIPSISDPSLFFKEVDYLQLYVITDMVFK